VLFTKYYYDDKAKEDDMDGTCSTHVRSYKCMQIFVGKSEEKRAYNAQAQLVG
jgi:hypothetical protein